MSLETFGKSLGDAVRRLLRLPIVDERAVKELVKDLQRTLLKADVNVKLVFEVSRNVEKRSLEEKLPPGVTRREHVIKVLYDELTRFLGEEPAKMVITPGKTHVIMLVGIQGSGKTTAAVKLARYYQKRGFKTGIICADTFRPGAFEQLQQLASKFGLTVFGDLKAKNADSIARIGVERYRKEKADLVIIDTAGRHKNEADLMQEMRVLAKAIEPDEIALVIDASIGQAALSQAKAFNDVTKIGSIIVTKLDGTAKGGGALSAVVATGAKIKFISTGEKIDDLEQFIPSSFVGRILGIGDLKGLIEHVKESEAEIPEKKARAFMEGRFTLRDMYEQLEAVRKLGPLKKIWSMIPGGYSIPEEAIETAEKRLDLWRVIIQSMTKQEVEEPRIVDSSRARRIARGSGTTERDVKELINQYTSMRKMIKTLKRKQLSLARKLPFQANFS
jgi:signal recognition particle subunit SRP54